MPILPALLPRRLVQSYFSLFQLLQLRLPERSSGNLYKSLQPPSAPTGPQARTLSPARRPLGGGNLSTSSQYPAGPQARSGSLPHQLRLRQEADRVGGEVGWRLRSTPTARELGRRGQGHLRLRDRSQLPAPGPLFTAQSPSPWGQSGQNEEGTKST